MRAAGTTLTLGELRHALATGLLPATDATPLQVTTPSGTEVRIIAAESTPGDGVRLVVEGEVRRVIGVGVCESCGDEVDA